MWGGLDARALFVELSIPLPSSETAACLQQSSIYDWAQSKRSERGLDGKNSTESQKSSEKHVFLNNPQNIENHTGAGRGGG